MDRGSNNANRETSISRKEFLVGGGALIAAIALNACSTKIIPTSVISTTNTALTPKYGGTLKIVADPVGANVGWPSEMMGAVVAQGCLECLLRGDNKGGVYPWLAESFNLADDLKSITFTLRRGVKFHDGSDFNAGVAKWNLDNMINAKAISNWASADVIDDFTIRVNFSEWVSNLPASFADGNGLYQAFMVSKAAFDKNGQSWMRTNPVGTGPFKSVSYQNDVGFKTVRNPDYWKKDARGNQLPYLDAMYFIFIADPVSKKMAIQAGEADMTVMGSVAPGADAAEFAAMGMTVSTIINSTFLLIPDDADSDSPWAKQKVREAAEYAINKEGIAKAFGHGYFDAAYQIPPPFAKAFNPGYALGRKYDPDTANRLLDEAGYNNNPRFKTTIIVNPMTNRDIVVSIQSDLAKVGIQTDLDFPDQGKWMTYLGPFSTWHNAVLFSPLPAFDTNFIGGLQWMFNLTGKSWLRTPEVDQAYQAVIKASSPDVELIRAVTDMMVKNASPIPIHGGGGCATTRPYVVAQFNERGSSVFWNTEETWINR